MIKQSEKQVTSSVNSPIKSIVSALKATFASYILLIICFLVLALVYTYTPMPHKYLTPGINIICTIALFFAGFLSSRKTGVMGYLHGAIAGFMFTSVRILLSLAVFDGYVYSDSVAKIMLWGVLISALGGIFGVNFGKNTKRKRK